MKRPWKSKAKRAALALAGVLVLCLLSAVIWASTVQLPADALQPRAIASVRIEDRDGTLLREVLSRPDGRARWVPLQRISPHVVQATLAGEDRRFFEHGGVDLLAMGRAVFTSLAAGEVVSGGSTVTMQLARLLSGVPRTLAGKARQVVLAYRLEGRLTKEQILWHYLNRAPYGNSTFGVEAAARRYLAKPASQLSLAEAALLSALPRSPAGYNPYRNRERLVKRQRYVLGLLARQGRISARDHRLALAEPIDWRAARRPFLAPHFTRRVLTRGPARGATRLRTTLHLPLQQKVETAVREAIARLSAQGVTNAAVLVVDNPTGEVLAHVGSADFFDQEHHGQVDGATALRQPGSTMKPFTYAMSLEQGKTPASLLRDLPAHFTTDRGDYAPRNYDNTFHGPVRLRVALGSSYNVPAVRMAEHVGVDRLLKRLRELGFASLKQSGRHYGLGLTLGNGEVTLRELVAAYAALARGGELLPLRTVLRARAVDGTQVPLPRTAARRVISREAAYQISHVLSDHMARLPAFGRRTPLDVGFPAAVKTGTSKDFRDNWTIGYTPQVTVGVWVGNFDGRSMHNVSGITGAGPLWAEVMAAAMEGKTSRFVRPANVARASVCPLSGKLPGPHCPAATGEVFVAGSEPQKTCDFHKEIVLDSRNGLLAGAACPQARVERRVMTVYPPVYRAWAARRGVPAPPTTGSPLCPPARAAAADVRIRVPSNGDRYHLDPDLRRSFQNIPLEATVDGWVKEVRWLVNGVQVARAPFPYTARWPLRSGRHRIQAQLPDGRRSREVVVTVQ